MKTRNEIRAMVITALGIMVLALIIGLSIAYSGTDGEPTEMQYHEWVDPR